MFTIESFVNTIQNGKKQLIKSFVTNDVAAKALTEFVDAQAAYTKDALTAFANVGTALYLESVAASKRFVNTDFEKFCKH